MGEARIFCHPCEEKTMQIYDKQYRNTLKKRRNAGILIIVIALVLIAITSFLFAYFASRDNKYAMLAGAIITTFVLLSLLVYGLFGMLLPSRKREKFIKEKESETKEKIVGDIEYVDEVIAIGGYLFKGVKINNRIVFIDEAFDRDIIRTKEVEVAGSIIVSIGGEDEGKK